MRCPGTDLKAAAQALLKSPTSTAVALLSLTLALGANTALFSLFNALLLRPLPVPQPSELVSLHTSIADEPNNSESFAPPMFESLGDLHSLFAEFWVYNAGSISNFEASGQHRTAALATVSGTYYRAMRLTPFIGRFIEPSDVALRAGVSNSVAVISFRDGAPGSAATLPSSARQSASNRTLSPLSASSRTIITAWSSTAPLMSRFPSSLPARLNPANLLSSG